MKEIITPEKIERQVQKGLINEKIASELLISLFDKTKNPNIRMSYLNLFGKYLQKIPKNFEFLENILISDQNIQLRSNAAEILIQKFPEEAFESLKWVINNENSPILLQKLFSFIQKIKNKIIITLNEDVARWFESFGDKININSDEARFFLDIETLFSKKQITSKLNDETYSFYKELQTIGEEGKWLLVKDDHIEELKFNFYKWKFLRRYPGQVSSLKKYRDLDLLLSLLIQMGLDTVNNIYLPASIGFLKKLKRIDLSQNYFNNLPESFSNLKKLEYLDLSYNRLNNIPEFFSNFKNLKYLDLRFNNIKKIPSFLKKLTNLNSLAIQGNKIKTIPRFLDSILLK